MEALLGPDGKRKLRLRQKTNAELFSAYADQLALKHQSKDALEEAKRVLGHFHSFLGEFPPSPELATSFLAQFASRKPTTLYRYHSIMQGFMTWYGEKLDTRIKVPETLPEYIESGQVENLKEALAQNRTHKKVIGRNILLVELDDKTGLRRLELAKLNVADINLERQYLIVRQGKGMKDRIVDLTPSLVKSLAQYVIGKNPDESLFGLKPSTISSIIHRAAHKAGVKIHTHSLRDHFAEQLVDNGTDLEIVRRLLGHSSLRNTQRYLGRTDRQRREAILRLESPTLERQDGSKMPSAELAPIRSQGLNERPPNSPKDINITRNSDPLAAALQAMLDPANHVQALKNVENVQICELSVMLDPANQVQALKNVENVEVCELSAMLDPANHIQALRNVENVEFSRIPVVSSDSVKRRRRPSGKAA